MELALLNTTIATADGQYKLLTVTLDHAKKRVAAALSGNDPTANSVRSYIGHEATVAFLSTLLDVEIEFNRSLFVQAPGQSALCFKLKERIENGRELSLADIEEIGYEIKVLTRIA